MTPEQFLLQVVTIKDQEATTGRCSFTKRFSTNHDLSFTKSTENSNTRISLGASSRGVKKQINIMLQFITQMTSLVEL
jgi:iron complex outermembrane receptor protein